VLQVGEVGFPPTRSIIFMINIYIYNHLFKVFRNRKHEGVEDLVYGKVGETN
jgi:hypothetical protein